MERFIVASCIATQTARGDITSHANRIELREQHVRKISRSRDDDQHTFIANNAVQQQEETARSMVRQYEDNADAKKPADGGLLRLRCQRVERASTGPGE
ncbi:MAG: hypothetical protein J0G34_17445 [Afipia sp.]|nr:hypothetical protein [Afipia sp.]